ncbi:MAG TPA: mechanosensitive ion channel domain-containing protein [Pirellulales bacterium]|nr:mechanosensitive ion channel domain-containing protein [Pirellulales bacterium]
METFNVQHLETWQEAVRMSFHRAFGDIVGLLPNVVGMLAVLVVGYIVARVLDKFATALSQSLGLQTAAERSGLAASMKQAGIQHSVPAIVGQIVFWLTMCVFLAAAFNILRLDAVSVAMEKIVGYIPNLLVATVVVVVGLLVAGFLRGVIATSADRVGISYAENLANAVYYVLALMTFIGAFDQLHIEFGILKELILIAAGGLALGFGLAFGLGGRDVMGGILAGYYLRQRMHAGDRIHVAGMDGTVRDVGPVATVIETEEDGLLNRHSVPNTKMLNEAVR